MTRQNLNGRWTMTRQSDGAVFDANIPGTDFGALMACDEIKNPLISGDETEALKIAGDSYSFTREFSIDAGSLNKANIRLRCGCVDTLCEIKINGKTVTKLNNAFIPLDADIKNFLEEGTNTVTFDFSSPYLYIKEKYKTHPLLPNNNGVNGIAYIRKPGCHFGWDWGPCVPYCGMTQDVYIDFFDREISDIKIRQDIKENIAVLTVTAKNDDSIELIAPGGETIKGDNGRFVIENPELWFPRDVSGKDKQPLYTVILKNDEQTVTKKTGLRTVRLNTEKDSFGRNFCFEVNGVKVFAKGANLIPFTALFEDFTDKTEVYYLDLAVKSGCNMLRVWGGGSYATESFLGKCDELGIMVWQDFCFACQLYPFYEKDFLDSVIEEIKCNVKRVESHPCTAIFCGNNEAEAMFFYLPKNNKLFQSYIEFFYNQMPPIVSELTDLPYIPSSPLGEKPFKKNGSDYVGDTHMWHVWHGLKKLDYYASRYTRFMSEFGLESLPSMKAIDTFAGIDDRSMYSVPFMKHQKCPGGNEKMMYYLTEMFRFPKEFESLPYLTGIVQSECVKNAALHFRQYKGRCNGCLYWQFNDVWNCPSWSAIDFEGVPKALAYRSADFFAPVTVSCEKTKGGLKIYAHNDTLEDKNFDVTLAFYSTDGDKIRENTLHADIKAGEVKVIGTSRYSKKEILQISFLGKTLTEIFDAPYKLNLKKADLRIENADGGINISSNTFAYNVCLEADGLPTENYFCLTKGQTKFIGFEGAPGEIKITCANNIEFEESEIKRRIFRFRYRLKPANIANMISYSFM